MARPDLSPTEQKVARAVHKLWCDGCRTCRSGCAGADDRDEETARVAVTAAVKEIAAAIEAEDGGEQGLIGGREARNYYAAVARRHAKEI